MGRKMRSVGIDLFSQVPNVGIGLDSLADLPEAWYPECAHVVRFFQSSDETFGHSTN